MQPLLDRYYWAILASLGAISLAVSFFLGKGEGRANQRQPVALSCSDTVLEELSIPAGTLAEPQAPAAKKQPVASGGSYLGSKNGTKYYQPSCASAKRIKPENRIWFKTADDAKLQGYTPGRC